MNTEHPNVTASADLTVAEFNSAVVSALDHFEACFGRDFSLFKTEELFCELRSGVHALIDAMINLGHRLEALERKDPAAL